MSDEYPANSHLSATGGNTPVPRPKLDAVVHGVRTRKKPLATRIAERSGSIWHDVLMEVVRPYIIDMFADAFHRGIDQTFKPGQSPTSGYYSGPRPGQQSQHVSASGYVVTDYNSQYTTTGPSTPMHDPRVKPFDFSIYTFSDFAAGRELIDRLRHTIHSYGHATVNDLYNLFGQSGDHVGENYGWDGLASIESASVKRVRGGGAYFLDIPDARPLKK